ADGVNCTIQDTEFWHMTSLDINTAVHADALQMDGGSAVTIVRNWFHDFEQACSAFDGTASNVITDNVIDSRPSPDPAWWLVMGGDNPASTMDHNTMIGGPIACGSKRSNPLSISIITNNIGAVNLTGIAGGANGKPTANHHNMSARARSPNINGS